MKLYNKRDNLKRIFINRGLFSINQPQKTSGASAAENSLYTVTAPLAEYFRVSEKGMELEVNE